MSAALAQTTLDRDAIPRAVTETDEPPRRPQRPTPPRRVLAFVRHWSIDDERPEALDALRTWLRSVGAELTVLTDGGVWSFDGDDFEEVASYSDRACGDMARTALLLGTRTASDMVYVIEGARVSKHPHAPTATLSTTIASALSRSENTV